ncbi:tyrosine-type recombinase/integrase [Rhodococcus sp. PAE-6]|uniref:Transposase n=1 Tax=Rhodococcus pyridinivorans AK37 TaxID=1114960 RepID=H0JYC1_9NOCA|nr:MULTISPECIES: tyrosine-type recombinase/integrase [Rhodococcus]EHK80582.1 transposase [Rhodococcus pyridinivorans AK37]MCT7294168.1 tyrosine-type recombinase/integrase [Rhodococcus sp. PAE-6]
MNGRCPPSPGGIETADPIWRLWQELPPQWRGPIIGPAVEDWDKITENASARIRLHDLPETIAAELAWMAHWQARDGTRSSVLATNQLANIVRRAIRDRHPFPPSIRAMDWDQAAALQRWFYATRWGRLPPHGSIARLRVLFRFARLALVARCHDGHWWQLDDWHPRCDPRIPLTGREPQGNYGCSPGQIRHRWLREAAKWQLGTALEAGTLRWSTVSQERIKCLTRFDRWLSTLDDPLRVLGDPADAAAHAATFRRWDADPAHRLLRTNDRRFADKPVHPRQINDDLRAVGELFAFVAGHHADAHRLLDTAPWSRLTEAHAASWLRQVTRIKHTREINDAHYVDDHAMSQILAALPLLGLPRDQQMLLTGDGGTPVPAAGFDDPQAMRMILLQILTGRRASEIRTCRFDCLTAPPASAVADEQIARFHYAQTKIDSAPDTILVDRQVTEIIGEQQRWVREKFPDHEPRFLFVQRNGNRTGGKPYPPGTYNWMLREFSDRVQITDSRGQPIRLSHTHRFRHTRFTRLAELGLPIHVLQRYAGHATPTMTMHYIAARQQHAEQAFLATVKLKADGTRIQFSRDDHDSLHLFDRADRRLPHGWCLLPPLQTCDKGNACLTCSVFVTDATHRSVLQRQLDDTTELIDRATTEFETKHGHPMPDDNIWLTHRRTEQQALARLLDALPPEPGHTAGSGCSQPATTGPIPLPLLTRRTQP